ncbi:MAG: hypothetical protein QOJ64_3199 [Acidobacteriota bacterium]|jgi:sensor c-di-GMP phosphodiesterase-like protein|nr:hypothetical protein [Acidobacteriota bacterium]
MSYHILHQFDEQWLADLKQPAEGDPYTGQSGIETAPKRRLKLTRDGQRWAIITAAVLLAAFALMFALDATQRAESLQQRLDAVERQVAGIKAKTTS